MYRNNMIIDKENIQYVKFMNTKATKLNTKEISPLDYIRKKIKEEIKKGGFTYQSFSELFNKTVDAFFENSFKGEEFRQ